MSTAIYLDNRKSWSNAKVPEICKEVGSIPQPQTENLFTGMVCRFPPCPPTLLSQKTKTEHRRTKKDNKKPRMITKTGAVRLPEHSNKQLIEDLKFANVDTLLGTAAEVLADLADSSNVFDRLIEEKIPKFHKKEMIVGQILGRGGFCVVHEVSKIRPCVTSVKNTKNKGASFICIPFRRRKEEEDNASSFERRDIDGSESRAMDDLKYSRDFVATRSTVGRGKGSNRYVVKTVSTDLDTISFMKGHVDIALEAKFLSVLDHLNIIELAAVGASGSCHPDYFLILERMTETLTKKIKSWMDRDRLLHGITGIFTCGKKKVQELYCERIAASYDITCGLYYLHSKNIIYRDLVSVLKSIIRKVS